MKNFLKYIVLAFFLLISWGGFSQQLSQKDSVIIDSLKKLDYNEIFRLYKSAMRDSLKAIIYAKGYLEKAREKNDTVKMCNAFTQILGVSSPKVSIRYADSIIIYAQNISNSSFPGLGYFNRGVELYLQGDYKESLKDFLTALGYAKKNKNLSQQLEIKEAIGGLKAIIGDYKGSLKNSKEILRLVEKSDDINTKLTAVYNVSLDYLRLDQPDSALIYIREGINKSLKAKDTLRYYDFVSASGYNEYYKGNYQAASDSLDKSFPYETGQNARINYYLYKGRIAKDVGKKAAAILHFKKLDSIYEIHRDPVRELPEVYQTFISYYEEKGDTENQLKYIDKLLAADSILDANFNYLNTNITKEYDIPILVSEKERIISQLQKDKSQSYSWLWILGGVSIISSSLFFFYYRRQRFYKKRFEALLKNDVKSQNSAFKPRDSNSNTIKGISEAVVKSIQDGLVKFEQNNEFLDHTINLNSLSKKLDTNSNYLSKVINFYKGKNFSNYLNDLRIEYAIHELKTNHQFRLYSVKGMAQEVGFNSPESFSKAFYKRTGIYPSYFLKQLGRVSN